jgi:hypothetical protein
MALTLWAILREPVAAVGQRICAWPITTEAVPGGRPWSAGRTPRVAPWGHEPVVDRHGDEPVVDRGGGRRRADRDPTGAAVASDRTAGGAGVAGGSACRDANRSVPDESAEPDLL